MQQQSFKKSWVFLPNRAASQAGRSVGQARPGRGPDRAAGLAAWGHFTSQNRVYCFFTACCGFAPLYDVRWDTLAVWNNGASNRLAFYALPDLLLYMLPNLLCVTWNTFGSPNFFFRRGILKLFFVTRLIQLKHYRCHFKYWRPHNSRLFLYATSRNRSVSGARQPNLIETSQKIAVTTNAEIDIAGAINFSICR